MSWKTIQKIVGILLFCVFMATGICFFFMNAIAMAAIMLYIKQLGIEIPLVYWTLFKYGAMFPIFLLMIIYWLYCVKGSVQNGS